MDENSDDLYERQLFAVFESCLTKGKNELEENDLSSICSKLHLDGLIEELRLCISKQPDKQTISFQEFRDGLLLLLKNFQGLVNGRQCIVQPYFNLNTYNVDVKNDISTSINMSHIYLQRTESNVTMSESKLICLWEKIQTHLRDYTDSTAIQFISSCIGIPELPKQITESMFERLDQNCDGLISLDEFVIIFQRRKSTEALRKHNELQSGIANCDVDTLDFDSYEPCGINSMQSDKSIDKEEAAGVSNVSMLLPSGDLGTLDTSLAEVTDIICDKLKSLNESLQNDSIQLHINLLQKILALYQEEQRDLGVLIENTKAEKEKMRIDMMEANERTNLLAQEIDEYQAQLEKTKEKLQKQNQLRYAEITKEFSDQLNMEREMDAAALKSKDDQLQTLQKENHDMKNKLANVLQDNQILEAENGIFFDQVEKLKQSNNDLLSRIKMLDAEHDEIQSMEAKQQEQVDFFVDRIKHLQSEITLLRDQNDELSAELETSKCHGNGTKYDEAPSSLAYDLQLDGNREPIHVTTTQTSQAERQADSKMSVDCGYSRPEQQLDISNLNAVNLEKLRNIIIRGLNNMSSINTKCALEKCAASDAISRLIDELQSNFSLNCLARNSKESTASEIETECDERAHESLRDFVVSRIPKSISARRVPISNSAEDLDDLPGQDIKSAMQNKTSLRDYPPRKEEHSAEQCKINKERDSSVSIIEAENVPASVPTNAELLNIEARYTTEKKQLIERCSEFERSLDLLRAEYEECEDYWAAKLEEERQLFEQEQKISDDKLAELISKIAEYEELISPLDKSKNDGRLSPIDEKFNLEQQYIDLEEEFEKWKMKTENDISRKNTEIEDLREKLRSVEQRATNDSWAQVPDEISLSGLSVLSHCNSSSASSIPSTNEPITSVDRCDINNRMYHASKFTSSNDASRLTRQKDQTDGCSLCDRHEECSAKGTKNIYKSPKVRTYKRNSHDAVTRKEDKCNTDFTWMQDVLMRNIKTIGCQRGHNNAQHHASSCIDRSILHNLNMKLYMQEHKKRQMQHHFQQQQQQLQKILHRIMAQHQTELYHLQCLLRDTQKRLDMQIQTTVNQADKLASADILVKDLYIENACLMEHVKHLQERCFILSGLNAETTSM